MRNRKTFAAFLATLLMLICSPAIAQLEAFRFRPDRVPEGQLLQYRKSQVDGSHEALISVYVVSADRIESLKWDEGGDSATLVVALMDWSTWSVRRFEAWQLARGGEPELRATMDVNGSELRASFMDGPVKLNHAPWHSFDFDFTSLNLALPHRRDPKADLTFWRTDFVHGGTPVMAEIGELRLAFEAPDTRLGRPAWRYGLGGAGLSGQQGKWWVDRRSGLTLEYELPVGDEPGYDSVRLKLGDIRRMTPAEWQAFKTASVAGS